MQNTYVRFKPATWGGPLVMHCHYLTHEDAGAMAYFQVEGGCKYDLGDNGVAGSCVFPTCPVP